MSPIANVRFATAQRYRGARTLAPHDRHSGYKNHVEEWSRSLEIAGETYTADELLDLLWSAPRGDASIILAHQLIAALLNGGATDPAIADVIEDAMAWMVANADADGRLPYGRASRAAHAEGTSLADLLAAYNEGRIGPGHCG